MNRPRAVPSRLWLGEVNQENMEVSLSHQVSISVIVQCAYVHVYDHNTGGLDIPHLWYALPTWGMTGIKLHLVLVFQCAAGLIVHVISYGSMCSQVILEWLYNIVQRCTCFM